MPPAPRYVARMRRPSYWPAVSETAWDRERTRLSAPLSAKPGQVPASDSTLASLVPWFSGLAVQKRYTRDGVRVCAWYDVTQAVHVISLRHYIRLAKGVGLR